MSVDLQNFPNNNQQDTSQFIESLAPADVLKNVERSMAAKKEREQMVMDKSRQMDQERSMLQKYIYDNANPPPLIITCIILGVLAVLYFIYLLFLKPSACGEWRDESGNRWDLNHNLLSGWVKIKINGNCAGHGKIIDNFVRYGDLVGIWDYNNEIAFIEGGNLYRLR